MSYYSKSWLNFLGQIEQAKKDIGFEDYEECFFRGHTHTSHKLLPGLLRGLKNPDKRIPIDLWGVESSLYYEFRSKAKELHNQNVSEWDILIFMQHHGVRTRLLDWTESLGVAIYFSLLNYDIEKSKPCIWIMNPYKFNEQYHDSRDLWDPLFLNYYESEKKASPSYSNLVLEPNPTGIFPWDEPIALYPVRRVDRLATQSGYFTIHGNDSRPIEQIIGTRKNMLKKIEIPDKAIDSAFTFLEYAGINQFTLFPGLDGLSKSLNYKYFEETIMRKQVKTLL